MSYPVRISSSYKCLSTVFSEGEDESEDGVHYSEGSLGEAPIY